MSKEKLSKLIKKQNGYLTTQDASKEGIHREYLTMFVKEKRLIRSSPGVYLSPNAWEDKLYSYQQKKKRMIYSHETALYLHGLSDRDPSIYAVTLPTGYNTSQLKQKDLKTYSIKSSLFELGKTTIRSPYENDIIVYDMERTICDIIRSRSRIDKQILNEGLKRYVANGSRDLNKLMNYAKVMKIENIVKDYMELLI